MVNNLTCPYCNKKDKTAYIGNGFFRCMRCHRIFNPKNGNSKNK